MSITMTGTNGLFTRLGKIGGWIVSELNRQGAATLTAPSKSAQTAYTDLLAQFTSGAAQSDIFDGFVAGYLTPYRVKSATITQLQTLARNLILRQVNDDTPLKAATLPYAIQEVIRQMGIATTKYLTPCTIAATTPAVATGNTNTGTAVFTSSVTGPYLQGTATGSGAMIPQFIFPETFVLKCTADSYTGGATAYQETFSFEAPTVVISDPAIWNFTTVFGSANINGSGATGNISICNPAAYANAQSGGNLLNNGDFLTFTSHNPNQWTNVAGTANTDYGDTANGSILGTTSALTFLATSTQVTLTQQFGNSGGTLGDLLPNTVYAGGVWAKKVGSATGTIILDLIDGSNAVITDNNAVSNTLSITVGSLTTSYAYQAFYFRTPAVLPSTRKFRIRCANSAVANALLSDLSFKPATRLYAGGPYVAGFRGATPSVAGDDYTAAFTNDYGNITNSFGLNWICNILFDLRNMAAPPPISNTQPPTGTVGYTQFPTVGTTNIVDTLVS